MKANWNAALEARYLILKKSIIPLSAEDVTKVERFREVEVELRGFEALEGLDDDQATAYTALRKEFSSILASLPGYWIDRYLYTTMSDDEKLLQRAQFQSLHILREQAFASEIIAETLRDPRFLSACEKAGIPPTRRQASKWNNGRRCAALRAVGVVR